ncbi:MAG: VOC family protein [Candidatus Liptonbacteria bacterium]|nr:VOC family protein [Candidatus Liptonbacteria bacterium]
MTESKDPAGHIKLAVSDLKKSAPFYAALFGKLGYAQVLDEVDCVGFKTPEGFGIWIEQAEVKNHPYAFGAPGLHHFCFKAKSPQEVDDVHAFLVERGVFIFDPPAKYPEYTESYYAVFFADPDGIKLELAYY